MSTSPSPPKRPAFIILGAPGSGKGTQGKILGSVLRFCHCACGDVFRSLDTRTALGQHFVDFSTRGALVPDELTIELWRAHIDKLRDTHVYKPIIDATQPPVKVLADIIQRITSLPVFHEMARHHA